MPAAFSLHYFRPLDMSDKLSFVESSADVDLHLTYNWCPRFSRSSRLTFIQGDQIGRILAQWAVAYFWKFLKIYRNSPQFLATFYQSIDDVIYFHEKMVWATFWAISHKLIWSP
jgi:hypothetical protein